MRKCLKNSAEKIASLALVSRKIRARYAEHIPPMPHGGSTVSIQICKHFFFFFSSPLFPQVLVCSRKDCFTGQSPGLWTGGWRRPSPSQSSLGGGWQAAGAGGVEGCLGEHLAEGGFVCKRNGQQNFQQHRML